MKHLKAGSWRERVYLGLAAGVIGLALRILGWTTRRETCGAEELIGRWARDEPLILAFWHGRLVMMGFAYQGRGACILNSGHRDGRLVARVTRRFGVRAVQGSSTRGWVGGLRGMLQAHGQGDDLIVVPDGPRGPAGQAKSGVVQLARSTGLPIFPVSYAASRFKNLTRSWDRMLIPLPGARIVYAVGEPIWVAPDVDSNGIEAARQRLEEALDAATQRAEAALAPAGVGRGEMPPTVPLGARRRRPSGVAAALAALLTPLTLAGALTLAPGTGGVACAQAGATASESKAATVIEREAVARKFKMFVKDWSATLEGRERDNRAGMVWVESAAGAVAEFTSYATGSVEVPPLRWVRGRPVGRLIYHEERVRLEGETRAAALVAVPRVLERVAITEIFVYSDGHWVW